MTNKKFGIPPCPLCKTNRDVEPTTPFSITNGVVEQEFYCLDCDLTFHENTNLLERICPRYEQWGSNALTLVSC